MLFSVDATEVQKAPLALQQDLQSRIDKDHIIMVLYLHSLSPVLTKLCKVDIISTLEMKSISVNSFQGTKIIQKIKTERRILVIWQWHLLFRIDVVNSLLRIRYLSQSIRSCSRKQPSSWGCQCGCQSLSHTRLSVTPWTVYGILQA